MLSWPAIRPNLTGSPPTRFPSDQRTIRSGRSTPLRYRLAGRIRSTYLPHPSTADSPIALVAFFLPSGRFRNRFACKPFWCRSAYPSIKSRNTSDAKRPCARQASANAPRSFLSTRTRIPASFASIRITISRGYTFVYPKMRRWPRLLAHRLCLRACTASSERIRIGKRRSVQEEVHPRIAGNLLGASPSFGLLSEVHQRRSTKSPWLKPF